MFARNARPTKIAAPEICPPVKVYAVDPMTQERRLACEIKSLTDHPLFLESDLTYYHKRGYTMADIKRLWDWEWFHLFSKDSRPARA